MSLALATLLYEWRRYSAAMVALAVAGLLILAQVGMFTGIVKGVTATLDRSRADLIIMPAKMESLINSGGGSLPARLQPQMYMHPEVAEVAAWDIEGGRWVNHPKDGKKAVTTFVDVNLVDTRPGAVTLPVDFTEETRRALMEPYSVAVDESQLSRLGVKLGDTASLNGKTIRVRAILTGYPNINNASITVSRDTLRLLGMVQKNGKTGPLMVRLKDPARAEVVRDQLNKSSKGAYRAWTRGELAEANQGALMKEQIIGLFITATVIIGAFIGVAITSMTLRGAILSSIKEFASLRALGVPMNSLRAIVLELSLWVGVAGFIVTAILTVGVYLLALKGGVPMGFPLFWDIFVAILLLVIAGLSGLFSIGVLKKSQPADLLR
ncbi:MAG: ABC transporter permease [Phenylobacterium sp.]|uniref:ABC transporter permease n=1 Tax=Phenylobacterium sp. TaxID=1871053 RepID=UPI00120E8E23|nr:ABC transporter permease [Phenylobacterium sp.]TAL33369.1 MAG: ABC transporter permease [Phenylobacterium sp.]